MLMKPKNLKNLRKKHYQIATGILNKVSVIQGDMVTQKIAKQTADSGN